MYTYIVLIPQFMTKFVKKDEINSKWFEIDASGAVVGRLATVVSKIIRGKTKPHLLPTWIMVILWL